MLDCEFHFFDFVPGTLPYTDNYKYLGHIINSKLKDDLGIMKRTKSLYARANTITRKFSSASLGTKWCCLKHIVHKFTTVRYGVICFNTRIINYVLLIMMHPHFCLENQDGVAHRNFVSYNVTFDSMIRKLVYSLWHSLSWCDNVMVCSFLNSGMFNCSRTVRRWHTILFNFYSCWLFFPWAMSLLLK